MGTPSLYPNGSEVSEVQELAVKYACGGQSCGTRPLPVGSALTPAKCQN
jgi:hypothetical protein